MLDIISIYKKGLITNNIENFIIVIFFSECTSTEFSCSSGQCIPSSDMCDTVEHCLDGSDEGAICGMS